MHKLNAKDTERTRAAIAHIQRHIDLEMIGLWPKGTPLLSKSGAAAAEHEPLQISDL